MNIILIGLPASGKGTQSKKIADKYSLLHVSIGDILHEQIKNNTEIGKEVQSLINIGNVVPDELILKLIEEKLMFINKSVGIYNGIIFDGFPRNVYQAEELDKMTTIDIVLNLEVGTTTLKERFKNRAIQENRPDDQNESIIDTRIEEYVKNTFPLREYYAKQNKLEVVNADYNDIEFVFTKICEVMPFMRIGNNAIDYLQFVSEKMKKI